MATISISLTVPTTPPPAHGYVPKCIDMTLSVQQSKTLVMVAEAAKEAGRPITKSADGIRYLLDLIHAQGSGF